MSKIFPIAFYDDNNSTIVQRNAFIAALDQSPYVDPNWGGMNCEVSTQLEDCVAKPEDFGVEIIPAYVFLRRLPSNPGQGVMVKKIEGRFLSTQEILAEIADSYDAAFNADAEGGGGSDDEDGDAVIPSTVALKRKGFLGLGSPFGAWFNCGSFLPAWLCKMKLGYVILFLILLLVIIFVSVAMIKKR